MINILYEDLPNSIAADGKKYKIYTDFRNWIQFSALLVDKEIEKATKTGLMSAWICDAPAVITSEIVTALFKFYSAKELEYIRAVDEEEIAEPEKENKPPVFDWCIDARYVLGDFRRFYNINLLEIEYIHWWEFLSLFTALPDDSACHKRMLYRSTNPAEIKNSAERNRIIKIQRQIALPFEYSDEAIADAFGGMI